MPLELLIQAGLTPTQAEILGFLLSTDALKAKDIISALRKPRGVIYKGLDELFELGLVEKLEKSGTITHFRAEHPSKLENLFAAKEKAAQNERLAFLQNLPELTSQYNLTHLKPAVNYYEGEAGQKQILEDTLRSKTDILHFVDQYSHNSEFSLDGSYSVYNEKRLKANIRERIIIAADKPLETPDFGPEFAQFTEIRYLGKGISPFKSTIKVYDNKITYETHDSNQSISVLIEDRNIYDTNKAMFEYLWQMAS